MGTRQPNHIKGHRPALPAGKPHFPDVGDPVPQPAAGFGRWDSLRRGGSPSGESKLQFIRENEGVIRWESAWTAGKFDYRCCGSMEYDGYQEYQITVTAREEAADAAHQLEIPYLPDTAAYWMGLGQWGASEKES